MVLKDNFEQLEAEKKQTQVEMKRQVAQALMLQVQVDKVFFIVFRILLPSSLKKN